MGRLLKLLFSRLAIVAALMLVQVGVLVAALVYFGSSYAYFQAVSVALSIVAIIYIINQNISPAYKIAWILPIAFLPVFGIPLYILFAKKPLPERKKQRLLGMLAHAAGLLEEDRPADLEELTALFDWSNVRRDDLRLPSWL